jgi:hypothetical protein
MIVKKGRPSAEADPNWSWWSATCALMTGLDRLTASTLAHDVTSPLLATFDLIDFKFASTQKRIDSCCRDYRQDIPDEADLVQKPGAKQKSVS